MQPLAVHTVSGFRFTERICSKRRVTSASNREQQKKKNWFFWSTRGHTSESEMGTNIINCLSWIPRGVAQAEPTTLNLTEEDLGRVITKVKKNLTEAIRAEGSGENVDDNMEVDDIVAKYNLEDYDDDDDLENDDEDGDIRSSLRTQVTDVADLAVYPSNTEDPYLDPAEESDSEDEREAFKIKPSDNLLAVGHNEGDAAILEVHVYNSSSDDFYTHHDFILPSNPICLEWMQTSSMSNCVAVGDLQETIHIYNLDIVNALEASIELKDGHTESVLSLSWNGEGKLASTGVDKLAFIWDVESQKTTFKLPRKAGHVIQTCQFKSDDSQVLAIGDCTGLVSWIDARSGQVEKKFKLPDGGEVEKVMWDRARVNNTIIASSKGNVFTWDFAASSLNYVINGHSCPIAGLVQSKHLPNCLVTGAEDKTLKLWDISSGTEASLVYEYKKCKVGKIIALEVNPDEKLTVAVSGDSNTNNLRVIDLTQVTAIKEHFSLD